MTDGGETTPEVTITTREAAREASKMLREQHRRRDRRRIWLLRLGIGGGVLLAAAIVAAVLFLVPRPQASGPENMQSDGIRIGAGGIAVRGPAVPASGRTTPFPPNPEGVLDIRIYVDYLSADNGAFERENAESIRGWVDAGTATVELHPLALLTTQSAGTRYSLRAANAAACVAHYAPDSFYAFHAALFADQPEEGSEGLSDEELIDVARDAVAATSAAIPSPSPTASLTPTPTPSPTGSLLASPGASGPQAVPSPMPGIQRCITETRFRAWAIGATDRAIEGPITGTELPAVTSTPTVIVNGHLFGFDPDADANDFRQFVLQVAGEEFVQNTTPAPVPTLVPTPGPTPSR